MQALLREARSKIESYDEQPKVAAIMALILGIASPFHHMTTRLQGKQKKNSEFHTLNKNDKPKFKHCWMLWCFVAVHDKTEYLNFFSQCNIDATTKNGPGEGSCDCWQSRGHRKSSPLSRNVTDAELNDLLFGITTSQLLGQEEKLKARLTELEAKLEAVSTRVTWECKFGCCFALVSLPEHLSYFVFSQLGRDMSHAKWMQGSWSRKGCRSAEGARSANCCRSPTRSCRRPCPWQSLDRFWKWIFELRIRRPWGSSFQSNTGSTCDCPGLISTRVSDPNESWKTL